MNFMAHVKFGRLESKIESLSNKQNEYNLVSYIKSISDFKKKQNPETGSTADLKDQFKMIGKK